MSAVIAKLQQRIIRIENDIKLTNTNTSKNIVKLLNNIQNAYVIEKEGKKVFSIDTIVGKEQINFHRNTVFNDVAQFGSLLIDHNKIISTDETGNIYLCPKKKGDVIVVSNPKSDMSVVTKKYVDFLIKGFKIAKPVKVRTTYALPDYRVIVKNNITTLVGEKISLNKNGIDNYKMLKIGHRIMVTYCGTKKRNNIGIYTIDDIGSDKTEWILKQAYDRIKPGLYVTVENGCTSHNTSWVLMEDETGAYNEFRKYSGEDNLVFQNIGGKTGIFKTKENSHVEFKSIYSDNLTIEENDNTIKINMDESKIDILKLIKQQTKIAPTSRIENEILRNKIFDVNSTVIADLNNNRSVKFNLEDLKKDIYIKFPNDNSELVGCITKQKLMNKEFVDTLTWFCDDYDYTKKMRFQLSSVPTNKTIVLTVPNKGGEIVSTLGDQLLQNKIFDMDTTSFKHGKCSVLFNFNTVANTQKIEFPGTDGMLVNIAGRQRIENKLLDDCTTLFQNSKIRSKHMRFCLNNIPPAGTCVLRIPVKSTEIVGIDSKQELTNKIIDFGKNNIIEKIKHNYTGEKDPSSKNCFRHGYTVGSRWINIKSMNEFVCVMSDGSKAIWKKTTL